MFRCVEKVAYVETAPVLTCDDRSDAPLLRSKIFGHRPQVPRLNLSRDQLTVKAPVGIGPDRAEIHEVSDHPITPPGPSLRLEARSQAQSAAIRPGQALVWPRGTALGCTISVRPG